VVALGHGYGPALAASNLPLSVFDLEKKMRRVGLRVHQSHGPGGIK